MILDIGKPGLLQELLWGDRSEPFYAVHKSVERSLPRPKHVAIQAAAAGHRFFAPVPLIKMGKRKDACTTSFDALWCDIDLDAGIEIPDALQETRTRLQRFVEMGSPLNPSAIVFSGSRGTHLYWKLDEDRPIDEVEALNRVFSKILGGDGACFDRSRLMRNPGTINERSGRLCEIIELSGEVHDLSKLTELRNQGTELTHHRRSGGPKRGPRSTSGTSVTRGEEWEEAGELLGGWGEVGNVHPNSLSGEYHRYVSSQPTASEFRAGGYPSRYPSRSEIELAIVNHLIRMRGASDQQLIAFADAYLPKHQEQRQAGRGNDYIDSVIVKARRYIYEHGEVTSRLGGWPKKQQVRYRHTTYEEYLEAAQRACGQPSGDWVRDVRAATGRSKNTVYKMRQAMLDEGWLRLEIDGTIHPGDELPEG